MLQKPASSTVSHTGRFSRALPLVAEVSNSCQSLPRQGAAFTACTHTEESATDPSGLRISNADELLSVLSRKVQLEDELQRLQQQLNAEHQHEMVQCHKQRKQRQF